MNAARLVLLLGSCMVVIAVPSQADDRDTDEDWAKAVRGSGSYQEGLRKVRNLIDQAYDIGALKGAAYYDEIHEYLLVLARAKGCQRGMPYAEGPVKACSKVSGKEPPVTGPGYRDGMGEVSALADQTLYPDLVRRLLKSLYDYGYVQGMKHGVRAYNDDIRIAQAYYRSCMVRANNEKGERACAEGSKTWSAALVDRWRKRIDAHGLPGARVR